MKIVCIDVRCDKKMEWTLTAEEFSKRVMCEETDEGYLVWDLASASFKRSKKGKKNG